jgi:hypothetical protein
MVVLFNGGGTMRRISIVVALALSLAIPASTSAQGGLGAPDFRDRFVEEFDIDDFCGTGETVHFVNRVVGNGWESETVFKLAFNTRGTYTYGDATVFDHWAGRVYDLVIEGDPEGEHTHLINENGLRAFLSAPGVGRVTRDAGNLQYMTFWGEDHEFLGLEVVYDKGNHPDFYEPVWCAAAIDLLGIPTS